MARDGLRKTPWLGLAGWIAAFGLTAGGASGQEESVRYPRDASTLVASYTEVLGELAGAETGPSVRVYGDGRVAVHYPRPMKRAGDYRLQLDEAELEALLLSLGGKLCPLDEDGIRQRKRQAVASRRAQAAARGAADVTAHVLDGTTSILTLRLDRYQPPPGRGVALEGVDRRIEWHGLDFDAKHYPDVPEIQDLAAAKVALRALMRRGDLVEE